RKLGKYETGSRAASPIWVNYTRTILKGRPVKDFPVAENVVFARIDAKTGLLAKAGDPNAVFEPFKQGTAPTKFSRQTTPSFDQFFKADLEAESH
ncbi:MAG: penicillin-binding protein, partial [Deltaproteobacteria bacterium]|nr:penicillin-binding protein [Deltaproteobacteria bacterium]